MSRRHILSEERGTDDPEGYAMGNLNWIRQKCTCGWMGSKWYEYHNFQHSECTREGQNHVNRESYNGSYR